MSTFIHPSALDPFQLQDLRFSAQTLAEEEILNRLVFDPDQEITRALAWRLVAEAERWANFSEEDADDDSYELIMDEFFESEECAKLRAKLKR